MKNYLKQRKEIIGFFTRNFLRGLLWFAVIAGSFILVNKYLTENYAVWLAPLSSKPILMYGIFLLSETIIGIIPPEFYMIWSIKTLEAEHILNVPHYLEKVMVLAFLSYIGGILAFLLGRVSKKLPFIRRLYTKPEYSNYFSYYRKYGGIMIVIAAVTPVPFGLMSTLSGVLDYTLAKYLLYASPRILRFLVYGWLMWKLNMV